MTLPVRLLFGILLLAACAEKKPPPTPPVPVTVALAERRTVPFELPATGMVEPIQTVAVQAQVSGALQRVAFKEGDEVKQGQILFQLDPRPYQAALQQASAVLERDRAQAANAAEEAKRYESLAAKEYVTPSSTSRSKRRRRQAERPSPAARPPWSKLGSIFSTRPSGRRYPAGPGACSSARETSSERIRLSHWSRSTSFGPSRFVLQCLQPIFR